MSVHSKELNAERLLQLSDEVGRIANTLARLSTDHEEADAARGPEIGSISDVPVSTVLAVIRARRMRNRYFDEMLFADPAWDMMLDLLQAELSHQRVSVSSLCAASAVPATTALRWLKTLVDKGLFVRRADPLDGRRIYVELSADTSLSLRRYFAELGKTPSI